MGGHLTTKYSYNLKLAILLSVTILSSLYIVHPYFPNSSYKLASSTQKPFIPTKPNFVEINGFPIRIVLPDSKIDLPIIPGYYDATTDSWSLSGYKVQFAMISTLPNNLSGQTFIYGHNNNNVFGAIRHVTPSVNQPAYIYTSNYHIFLYRFENVKNLGPTDISILKYSGKPSLVIQTCTGSFNEWRTVYTYKFVKVVS